MELETVNKLYLELSQVATAKTKRELELEDLLRSAHAIAVRKGESTAWERFSLPVAPRLALVLSRRGTTKCCGMTRSNA